MRMKTKTRRLVSDYTIETIIHDIRAIGVNPSVQVTIGPARDIRRNAQNKLLWHWNNQLADQLYDFPNPEKFLDDYGVSPAVKIHIANKWEILRPLYREYGEEDLRYLDGLEALAEVSNSLYIAEKAGKIDAETYDKRVGEQIDHYLSTKMLSVREFAEYLTRIEHYWVPEGYTLTTSDDLYFEAVLGTKNEAA